jgi:hypothetical protein
MRTLLVSTLLLTITTSADAGPSPKPRAAVPIEPITGILDAIRDYPVVAIGDDHGNEQIHAFRLALIRDPRFASVFNDIVVEFGSARCQDVMDRFIDGGDVPPETLREAWQNTTQPEYEWDLPIYEEFFRAVRETNASLPLSRKVRVLLGDPPIDWAKVSDRSQLREWVTQRDRHAVGIIRREVLNKGRRALVIYGSGHLGRKNTVVGAADEWSQGIVAELERAGVAHVFTIYPETHRDLKALYPAATGWHIPSLVKLRGTELGGISAAVDARERTVRMEDQFDAVLYLGPFASMTKSHLAPALCSDTKYMEMRLGRLSLLGATTPASRLTEDCANPSGASEIMDRDPRLTESVRAIIRDAATGTVDPERISPESRDRVVPLLRGIGTRFLQSFGPLESLTLVGESNDEGKRVRRYRAVFAGGQGKSLWTVTFSSSGLIESIDPRPE